MVKMNNIYPKVGTPIVEENIFLGTSAVVEGWTAGTGLPLSPYLFLKLPLSQTLAFMSK